LKQTKKNQNDFSLIRLKLMDNSVGSTLTTKMQKLCLNFDVTETNLFFVVAISDATEFTDQLIISQPDLEML